MNIFITADRQYYRRWISLLPSLWLAGSAHFIAGKRLAGVGWFLTITLLNLVYLWRAFSPSTPLFFSVTWDWSAGILLLGYAGMLGDACRHRILRMGFKRWAGFLGSIFAIVIVPYVIVRTFLVQPFRVPTSSMQPTVMAVTRTADGSPLLADRLLVNKLRYRFHPPQRGDVAVFLTSGIRHPQVPKGQLYIKRIVGIPGDRVAIQPPFVLINGEKLLDPLIFATISARQNGYSGFLTMSQPTGREVASVGSSPEIKLGTDEYYVLGDNTQNSLDSRYFGPIQRRSIIGKAFYIYASIHRKGMIQ